MKYFILLMRPINLLIIAATMFGLASFFDAYFVKNGGESLIFSIPFILLVVSTILIAGAGNIINDYFDVKADRVNRPESIIIGKHIKRRWAILTHTLINVIAFVIAIYLSVYFKTFLYVFVHLLSINLLWFYSSYFKRTMVFGNIIVALLTALVPFLVGIFYNTQDNFTANFLAPFNNTVKVHNFILYFSIALGIFAFLLNWAREIIKDIEDVEGDKKIRAKTLPISIGNEKSKLIATVILLFPAFMSLMLFFGFDAFKLTFFEIIPAFVSALFVILSILLLWTSKSKKQFKSTHVCIKLAMISGLILPLYWVFYL